MRLDRLAGGRHAVFKLAFAGGAIGVAMIFYHFVVTIGGHFREVERSIEFPSHKLPILMEIVPPENRLIVQIHGAGISGRPEPAIVINNREMKGWPEARSALRKLQQGGPFGGYVVFVVPDDDAPFGLFAKALGLLYELRFPTIQVRFPDEPEPKR